MLHLFPLVYLMRRIWSEACVIRLVRTDCVRWRKDGYVQITEGTGKKIAGLCKCTCSYIQRKTSLLWPLPCFHLCPLMHAKRRERIKWWPKINRRRKVQTEASGKHFLRYHGPFVICVTWYLFSRARNYLLVSFFLSWDEFISHHRGGCTFEKRRKKMHLVQWDQEIIVVVCVICNAFICS